MPMSNSVVRRYTSPTCRLQILTHSSPVSNWLGQSGRKQLRFELRFDHLQLPQQQQVIIEGDRDHLEVLHKAVSTYVQNLLNRSPEQFNAVLSSVALSFPSSTPGTPISPNAVTYPTPSSPDLSTDDSQALPEEHQALDPFYASAHLVDSVLSPKESTPARSGEIFLQPGSGLAHNIELGPLATQESGPVIQLSVLQLFDLATALDEYAADVVALPAPNRSRVTAGPSAWASIAAVLLVALGLTTALVTLNRSTSQQQTANRKVPQGPSSNNQQPNALQSSPVPTLGLPTPPLSSPDTLSYLPPVGSIAPSTNPSSPTVSVPGTEPTLPSVPPVVPIPQTTPVSPIPGLSPDPPIRVNPVPRQDSSVSIPREAATPRTNGVPTPSFSVAPPSIAIPSPSYQLPPPNVERETPPSEATQGAPTAAQPRSDSASPTQSLRSPTTPNEPKVTAFNNNIPQVAEVRDYFNQRWEPPSSLRQDLQYSLVLDVDGTIQRIEPLGQAARNYVDRTGMPLIGERFVSANKNGQTPRIRVVLTPDGTVQTFLEEDANANAAEQPGRPGEVRKSQPLPEVRDQGSGVTQPAP